MKYLIIFLIFLDSVIGIPLARDKSFQDIYKKNQNDKKIVLMIYTATTCPQCAYMKKKVFEDPKVKDLLEKNFVILEKNIDKDDLLDGFEYFGIPTIFFVDKNGKEISKFVGSSRAEPFLKTLQKIMEQK